MDLNYIIIILGAVWLVVAYAVGCIVYVVCERDQDAVLDAIVFSISLAMFWPAAVLVFVIIKAGLVVARPGIWLARKALRSWS